MNGRRNIRRCWSNYASARKEGTRTFATTRRDAFALRCAEPTSRPWGPRTRSTVSGFALAQHPAMRRRRERSTESYAGRPTTPWRMRPTPARERNCQPSVASRPPTSVTTPGVRNSSVEMPGDTELAPGFLTAFRGSAVRSNYLGPDPCDAQFDCKEVCRSMAHAPSCDSRWQS